jgi:hypothetical protein
MPAKRARMAIICCTRTPTRRRSGQVAVVFAFLFGCRISWDVGLNAGGRMYYGTDVGGMFVPQAQVFSASYVRLP